MSKSYEAHARSCMAELVKLIERDPVEAHRSIDHLGSKWLGRGFFLGVVVATLLYAIVIHLGT